MREIHHRVKNNLQVISSLLNMQQRALTDPAARAAMSDTRQRITALALIYRALYQGPDLKRVDLRQFLDELIAQLVVGEPAHGRAVRTELTADALIIDPDQLAPLALFAVEAITNAQKHAFAGRGGMLRVRFTRRAARRPSWRSPTTAGPATPRSTGAGVGRTLMTAFARQLRGRVELVPNDAGGVTARLIFPTPAADAAKRRPGRQPRAGEPSGSLSVLTVRVSTQEESTMRKILLSGRPRRQPGRRRLQHRRRRRQGRLRRRPRRDRHRQRRQALGVRLSR